MAKEIKTQQQKKKERKIKKQNRRKKEKRKPHDWLEKKRRGKVRKERIRCN